MSMRPGYVWMPCTRVAGSWGWRYVGARQIITRASSSPRKNLQGLLDLKMPASLSTAMGTRMRSTALQPEDVAEDPVTDTPPSKLVPLDDVNRWMGCARTVDQDLGVYDRTELWCNLRLLAGLDVEEFLLGSRHAYQVVSELTSINKSLSCLGLCVSVLPARIHFFCAAPLLQILLLVFLV